MFRPSLISGLFALMAAAWLPAQQPADTFRQVLRLPVEVRFATSDNLGNIYLIDRQNALEKYSPEGRLLTRYTNNRLGQAARIDVANPMKVLVWYADFRTVVFLDRNLTLLGELNLIRSGFPEVRAVAAAADGNIWLYDEVAFRLKKVTPEGALRFESQALSQLQSTRIAIRAIRDSGAELLASDPELGLLWFDVYGQFQRLIPQTGIDDFVLAQQYVLHLSGGRLHIGHLQGFASQQLDLPAAAKSENARTWLAPGRLLTQANGGPLEVWAY